MIIRSATEADYEAICELTEQVDQLHRERLPHIYQVSDGPARQREYIYGLIGAENVGLFVAELDGRIKGFIVVIVRMSSDIPILVRRCFALIENLCVDQEYQGQGIGEALMIHAQKWAKEMGATSIELTVYEFNRKAGEFYRRLGFQTESRRMTKEIDPSGDAEE